jgi:hypothetical protein
MADEVQIRIGHCGPDAPTVDVRVDGETAFEGVAYEQITDYAPLPAGSHEVSVAPHGEDEAVLSATVSLDANTHYTALATGTVADDDLQATVLEDAPGDVPADKAHVRLVHCAPDAPPVDVRVAGGETLFSGIGFREAGAYTPVDAGSHDMEVVPTGTDDVALSLPETTFEGGAGVSVIAVGRVADDSLGVVVAEDARRAMAADDD